QIELSYTEGLIDRELIVMNRFGEVDRASTAALVIEPEVVLGFRRSLLCRTLEPAKPLLRILRHTVARDVNHADLNSSVETTVFGGLLIPLDPLPHVHRNSQAVAIE